MKNLNEVTSKELLAELESRGFILADPWRVEDVHPHIQFFNAYSGIEPQSVTLTDSECRDIVESVLRQDAYYEWVNESISVLLNEKYFSQEVS